MLESLIEHQSQFDTYTELRAQTNTSIDLMMRQGQLLRCSTSRLGGVSARCYRNGAFGFSSIPSFEKDDIKKAISWASDNAYFFKKKANLNEPDLPEIGYSDSSHDYHTHKDRFTMKQRVSFLNQVNEYIKNTYKDLINWDISYRQLGMEKALVASNGTKTYSYIPRSNLIANFSIKANDGSLVELYKLFGGFGEMEDNFDDPSKLFPGLDKHYEKLKRKAEGVMPRAGYHDVILDSNVAGILAHEAIGHTVEGDFVLSGSIAADHLGDMVASEKVSLIDYKDRGPDNEASIAIHVDDEGTPCRDVTIIENGKLIGYLHNKETARRLDMEPTGNARAYEFSDEPLVRMRNTAIVPGDDKLDDMIAEIEDGYYLIDFANGQADSTSEFMFGITSGYEIKNGKLERPIRDTTISGVAFDMLKTVTHVSDDMTWSHGGMCGKKQMIPVGMGGPAIKCKINIGGQ